MINKIIAEYLRTNKRLVVPHFGAFIRKENSEAIVFVPFLKKDDGVLQQLLVSEYGMDSADAQAVIDEYIAEIKESIAARGAYVIEGVGRLMTDSNGICYLELGAAPAQAAAVRPADTGIPVGPASFPAPSAEPARHTKIQQQARPTEKPTNSAQQQPPRNRPPASRRRNIRPIPARATRSLPGRCKTPFTAIPILPPCKLRQTGKNRLSEHPCRMSAPESSRPGRLCRPKGGPPARDTVRRAPVGRQAPKSKADGFIVICHSGRRRRFGRHIFGLTVTHGGPDILPLIESSSPDTTQVQPIAE